MNTIYDLKLESDIKKLGFKKQWFQDKSGYWFIKVFKYKDLSMRFYLEADNKYFSLQIKTGDLYRSKSKLDSVYNDAAKFKCDLKTIKETLKRYK